MGVAQIVFPSVGTPDASPKTSTVYEPVPPGAVVDQMYSVLKMREYRIYFEILDKVSKPIDLLAEVSQDIQIQDKDFKYLYAQDIRPVIRKALEDNGITVTTTSVVFPDPVEDSNYIQLSVEESSWGTGKTVQTPKRCQEVRNFIRGIAIHLANIAYTPYPDVEFIKRQSAEINAFRERCFLVPSKFE